MNPIELKLDSNRTGAFVIEGDNERLAEMRISIANGNLTVFHTEVSDSLKGHGVAIRLLSEMVDYARKNHLKVIPLCTYVQLQFKRHPEMYQDVWNQDWHK